MFTRPNFHPIKTTPEGKHKIIPQATQNKPEFNQHFDVFAENILLSEYDIEKFQRKRAKDERTNKILQSTNNSAPENNKETKQHNSITSLRRRVPQVEQTSKILNTKGTKTSQNISLKSHYCLDELKKHEVEYSDKSYKRGNGAKNPPFLRNEIEGKRNENNNCDVTFLRKLLAMNKKEELILNRKLAKLVLEEEFGLRNETANSFTKNLFSNTSVSNFDSSRGRNNYKTLNKTIKSTRAEHPSERVVPYKSNINKNSFFPTQYDLNGRRIYYDSENNEESEDEDRNSLEKYASGSEEEHTNPPVKFTSGRSKTYINTTTVIKTKSDIICDSLGKSKMSSRRNSLVLMNKPIMAKKENSIWWKKDEETDDESKYKKSLFTKVDASGKGSRTERRESSPGDGVQNVVVHCCEVAHDKISSESKKKVLKVWNFNDIPKIKPPTLETSTAKLHLIQKNKESQATLHKNKEVKPSADERSNQKTSALLNMFGKQKSRPNTVC